MKKKTSQPLGKDRKTNVSKHRLFVLYALVAVIVAVIILVKLDIIGSFSKVTIDYLEAKNQFAKQLSRALSIDQEKFRIAAINGPIYQPGYVLDLDNPINPLTDKCTMEPGVLKSTPWTSLPEVVLEENITVDIGTSNIIKQFTKDIAEIGGKIKKTESGTYKLTDIHQVLATWDDFIESLAQAECQKAIDGRDVIVVRGQIFAKEIMSTSRELGAGLKPKIIGAGLFLLNYNNEGDFSIEDKEAIPRFHIVSTYFGSTRGSIDEMLKPPTDDQIKILESIGTQ